MRLTALSLQNFRSYGGLSLPDLPCGLIALTGPNGAGKTNILEAISLLSPGRGLRTAHDDEIQANETETPWAIHAHLDGPYGPQKLGIGIDGTTGKRVVHLNGEKLKNAQARADLVRCVWLTPREDRLFMDGASARRKWLDRLVFSADPAHAGRITRLDRLLAERNRLLALDRADPLWLDAIEADLAATALAVSSARLDYIDRLRLELAAHTSPLFPIPAIAMHGYLEEKIGHEPALGIEEDYRRLLCDSRARDRAVEATTTGPHRADLIVTYTDKNMIARECSTGEQKALLFALFMAHVRLVAREFGAPPLLLLDEITAHLDPDRRHFLLTHLHDVGAQVFMSATEDTPFLDTPATTLYRVTNGGVHLLSSPSRKVA